MSICKYSLRVLFILLFGSFFINVCSASAKISVIVPVYNAEKWLCECLDSIINQTYKNLEILCLNDGSTDGSKNILEEYAKKDDRIKVIDQDENKGVSAARNKGIDNATGEWITFVDADDYLARGDTYEIAMSKKEEGTDILGWNHCYVKGNGCVITRELKPKVCKGKDKAHLFDFSSQDWFFAVWDYIYRSDMLKDNKLRFNEELVILEDTEFNTLAFIVANKIQFIDDVLYVHRWDVENSSSDLYGASCSFDICCIVSHDVWEFFKDTEILKNHKERFLMYLTNTLYSELLGPLLEDISPSWCITKSEAAKDTLYTLREYYGNELEKYYLEKSKSIDGCACEKCLKTIEMTSEQLGQIFKLAHDREY